jgi:hypothetical protein
MTTQSLSTHELSTAMNFWNLWFSNATFLVSTQHSFETFRVDEFFKRRYMDSWKELTLHTIRSFV